MLMTEQEARTKWCPKYQVCGNSDADNRPSSGANCIAAGCMAWRWADPAERRERRMCEACNGAGERDGNGCEECEGEGFVYRPYPTPARRGYCGAFGKAEG